MREIGNMTIFLVEIIECPNRRKEQINGKETDTFLIQNSYTNIYVNI